jgi:hypothetical protein
VCVATIGEKASISGRHEKREKKKFEVCRWVLGRVIRVSRVSRVIRVIRVIRFSRVIRVISPLELCWTCELRRRSMRQGRATHTHIDTAHNTQSLQITIAP